MGRRWISIPHLLLRQRFARHEEASKRPVPKALKITTPSFSAYRRLHPVVAADLDGVTLLESNRQTHEGLPVDVSIVSL